MRNPDVEKPRQRRKLLVVEPGKSISMDDLNDECDQDGNLDANTDTNTSQSTSTDNSEDSLSEPPDEGTIPLVDEKKHVKYDDVKLNQWVQVVYEGEFFWGKVLEKSRCETLVQCLEKPYGIKEPQNLEREHDAVYCKDIYESNVTPHLTKVGRSWKYCFDCLWLL